MASAERLGEAYEYFTAFAERCVALGMADGESWGRAALLTRQLTVRFGAVSDAVERDLRKTSLAELDAIGERLLSARTLEEALGGALGIPDPTPEEHLAQRREAILALFRKRPALAVELLRDLLGVSLPDHAEVRILKR